MPYDSTVSLETGQGLKVIEQQGRSLGLTPTGYRRRWGLPKDYPMAAPNYAAFRSGIGRALGRRELAHIAMNPGLLQKENPAEAGLSD